MKNCKTENVSFYIRCSIDRQEKSSNFTVIYLIVSENPTEVDVMYAIILRVATH